MKKLIILLIPFIFLAIGIFNKDKKSSTLHKDIVCKDKKTHLHIKKNINSVEFFEDYVVDVIKNGSTSLGFPTKMKGGFVNEDEAKKIAAYLATLQGFSPTHKEYIKEGAALYYGNCVGCHQKGVKQFPDLSRKPLLGIEKLQNKR
jgi:hypothetical protein